MDEKNSHTYKTTNALITIHGFTPGTAILSITGIKDSSNHAGVWMSPTELRELGIALLYCASTICEGDND